MLTDSHKTFCFGGGLQKKTTTTATKTKHGRFVHCCRWHLSVFWCHFFRGSSLSELLPVRGCWVCFYFIFCWVFFSVTVVFLFVIKSVHWCYVVWLPFFLQLIGCSCNTPVEVSVHTHTHTRVRHSLFVDVCFLNTSLLRRCEHAGSSDLFTTALESVLQEP